LKIILDTNVIVSGIFFSGPPYEILKAWRNGKFKIVVSIEILFEYQRIAEKLNQKFPMINIQPMIDLFTVKAVLVNGSELPIQICKDPGDDKFISCALASNSKIIITGDKHLLNVNGYEGLEIIRPREFFEKYI
jgi:putative PIN family toxin of toxin-antitoxin system